MPTSVLNDMTGPELVKLYNQMAETAGMRGREVSQVKRFKDHKTAVARTRSLAETLEKNGGMPALLALSEGGKKKAVKVAAQEAKPAKKTARPKRQKEPKEPKAEKQKFGHDMVITHVGENKRFKNSKAHGLYDQMAKYMAKHPDASVEELIDATDYRRQDFEHDHKVGSIKTRKK